MRWIGWIFSTISFMFNALLYVAGLAMILTGIIFIFQTFFG